MLTKRSILAAAMVAVLLGATGVVLAWSMPVAPAGLGGEPSTRVDPLPIACGSPFEQCGCEAGDVPCQRYHVTVHTPARDATTGQQLVWRTTEPDRYVPIHFTLTYCQAGEPTCLNCEQVRGYFDNTGQMHRIGTWPPVMPGCTELADVVVPEMQHPYNFNWTLRPPCPPGFGAVADPPCFTDTDYNLWLAPWIRGTHFFDTPKMLHNVAFWTQTAGAPPEAQADNPAVFLQGQPPCVDTDQYHMVPDPSHTLVIERCDFHDNEYDMVPIQEADGCLITDFRPN